MPEQKDKARLDGPALDRPGPDKPASDKPGSDKPGSDKPALDKQGLDRLCLDEQTFGRLVEAAYVLQTHSRELQKLERHLKLGNAQLSSPELRSQDADSKKQDSPEQSSRATGNLPSELNLGAQDQFSDRHSSNPDRARSLLPEEHFSVDTDLSKADRSRSDRSQTAPIKTESDPEVRATKTSTMRPSAGRAADYTATLAQIVQTQHQIRARHLELENSMSLVAERVTEIAKAGGAAIGFLDDAKRNVRYRGVAGEMTLPAGTEVALDKSLCAASLRTGQIIRCADVNPEFLFDPEECRRRGIQAMIAVPIFHEGGIAGGLELYYPNTQAFTEEDVHTCQLMAGLITEALAREDELGWKKSLANERADMLEALEKLKPKPAASTGPPAAALTETPAAKGGAAPGAASRISGTATAPPTFVCLKCGHQLVGQEQFCGKCGTRRGSDRSIDASPDRSSNRSSEYERPSMQSKLASLWEVQESIKKSAVPLPANGDMDHVQTALSDPTLSDPAPSDRVSDRVLSDPALPEKPLADSIEEEMPELFAAPELRVGKMGRPAELPELDFVQPSVEPAKRADQRVDRPDLAIPHEAGLEDDQSKAGSQAEGKEMPEETALAKPLAAANWTSALTARQFLEQLAETDQPGAFARFWKARRGDIYLGIAVVLVAAVIRWGIWSNHSVSATGKPTPAAATHRPPTPAPEPEVSLFDRMLISLGVADPPPAPEYKGNPETQVWVDLHTALYYCPGADLYGKTPKGKFTSQRDAQLDQFEPAYRKACD